MVRYLKTHDIHMRMEERVMKRLRRDSKKRKKPMAEIVRLLLLKHYGLKP